MISLTFGSFTRSAIVIPHSVLVRCTGNLRLHRRSSGSMVNIAIAFRIVVHGCVEIIRTPLRAAFHTFDTRCIRSGIGKHGNIYPRTRHPPRIVIAFLRTLKAVAIPIGVLPSTALVVAIYPLVCSIKTLVTLCALA